MASRAVLFDLFDTLLYGDWKRHRALVAARLGVDPDEVGQAYDQLRNTVNRGGLSSPVTVLNALAGTCGVDLAPGQAEELAREETRFLRTEVRPFPDAIAGLDRLRRAGLRIALVSNCSPTARPIVDSLGLDRIADRVILSFEVGATKPSPEIFDLAARSLGADPADCAFVDDRADYLDGAERLGMATFRMVRSMSSGEQVSGGAHREVTGMADLENHLLGP